MKDLVSNLFILSFLLAYTVVFILLLQWMVRRWWEGRRKRINRARHPVAQVASELPTGELSPSRIRSPLSTVPRLTQWPKELTIWK